MTTSKAPKSHVFGTTASAERRVACAMAEKNEGRSFITECKEKLSLSSGNNTVAYSEQMDGNFFRRKIKITNTELKKQRLSWAQARKKLRFGNKSEKSTNYESNDSLLINESSLSSIANFDKKSEPVCVFFDLETESRSKDTVILQIAAKCKDKTFSIHIAPPIDNCITEGASNVNGLTGSKNELLFHGVKVESFSLQCSALILRVYEK